MSNFSEVLSDFIKISGVKNQVIADAVGYDVSYISKWLSGKMLPSEKAIGRISSVIGECIANYVGQDSKQYENLLLVTTGENLGSAITDELNRAYACSLPEKNGTGLQFCAGLPYQEIPEKVKESIRDASQVHAIIDIFSMSHSARLPFAGIRNGIFCLTEERQDKKVSLVVNIPEKSSDSVYDAIFLIHMMTGLSRMDMNLYHNQKANGKLLYTAEKNGKGTALTGVILDETICTAVAFCDEIGTVDQLRQTVELYETEESSVFRKLTMESLIRNNDYIKSLISTNLRWVLGHATELILPDDVFEELADGLDIGEKNEFRRLHALTASVIEQANTCILVYESVLSALAVSGELDFFNRPVILSPAQRLKCLTHYENIAGQGEKLKIIDTGFSSDFKNISNPCLMMSDSVCYLRLENGLYHNNIMTVKSAAAASLFSDFFEYAWKNRNDVVSSAMETSEIIGKYKTAAHFLEQIAE